ncbi:hypothetical protein DPMN_058967 [Dreissena polymorpha]|uniref:NAD-dependent epimerase/dehydratase domain-containing protein n=1 Tax=Dreissena polymorpha TaxID=45954 RepID=A0A9D4C368_DREPO|nr:hypothetical protein DPMN_058967 [Dreissena polymorpha]
MAAAVEKPKILILGGTGFIGRNFVLFLVKNDLASKIRVSDKVPPPMAWMNSVHKEAFANPVVEFKHANLINPVSVSNVFTLDEGNFDFAVNLAAETKYGQSDKVYSEGIVRLSLNCAKEAEKRNIKFYIEMSSGQMASSEKKGVTEDCKPDPWTKLAEHKLAVEQELQQLTSLKYAVLRPAIVYGPGDSHGLTPRLMIGAIYKYIKQKMKMLWTKQLHMNTVHVEDLCRAVWHVLQQQQSGNVYNVVDRGDTTQGLVSDLVAQVFGISYEFLGAVKSNLARVNMAAVVEDINDKHMTPWAEACTLEGITNTPLNPFLDQELLYNKHLFLDGSKLESTGFTFDHPELKASYLQQVLDDYIKMKIFPACLLSGETSLSDRLPELDVENNKYEH